MKKIVLLVLVVVFTASCATKKEFVYFQSELEQRQALAEVPKPTELKIRRDDILAIVVSSVDARAANPYNLIRSDVNTVGLPITDFLVDAAGNIEYPGIGAVSIEGLTIIEAKEKIKKLLSPFIVDAVVNIRITNFRIRVLGEVTSPSTYIVQNEYFTIIDALSMAGDINNFGDREHVTIIREYDGKREIEELNLLSDQVFNSPFFQLRQNDLIYVPPTKGRALSARSEPLSRVILPIVGVLTSLASLIIVASR